MSENAKAALDMLRRTADADGADAYMYPTDLEAFRYKEMNERAFSLRMMSPTKGDTVPLFTLDSIERALAAQEDT